MTDWKLESLTTPELLDIRECVNALLKDRVANERREIERTLARIGEVTSERPRRGRPPSKMRGAKVPPKYRNPVTGETWAGRGMRPRWLRGRQLETFVIDRKAAAKKRIVKKRSKKRRST
jgi:DNA-binding protein H-NS